MTWMRFCAGNGRGRSNTASTSENMATLMPIPSARIPIAPRYAPRCFSKVRAAGRRFRRNEITVHSVQRDPALYWRNMNARGAYKWWVVGMLWLVCFLNYADRQAIFSVFPLLKTELRLTDFQLGIAGTSFMWVYALVGPLAGWLGDRLSRKSLILGALAFWSVVTAA